MTPPSHGGNRRFNREIDGLNGNQKVPKAPSIENQAILPEAPARPILKNTKFN